MLRSQGEQKSVSAKHTDTNDIEDELNALRKRLRMCTMLVYVLGAMCAALVAFSIYKIQEHGKCEKSVRIQSRNAIVLIPVVQLQYLHYRTSLAIRNMDGEVGTAVWECGQQLAELRSALTSVLSGDTSNDILAARPDLW